MIGFKIIGVIIVLVCAAWAGIATMAYITMMTLREVVFLIE
jgi:hypothetical protein